eukprot:CAMPEP_0170325386 /NCGR_PEP_ID=MMETSP0116_2-20130129/63557_1 /TAXON_ID=400756 /ORGANISM="Durinskia baltica, Strain CSIRO CS-38" /LENGTH=312 /DNA_ID=CAMNT_0010578417 /DNA_START=33 /DNA_END=969 /DNA_ORIENTATION=+
MVYSLRNTIALAQLMMGCLLLSPVAASQPPRLIRTTVGSITVSSSSGHEPKRGLHFDQRALLVRGGEIELSTDDDEGFLLTKLRNLVRGILRISDTKAPVLSSILRVVVKTFTGIKILSVKKEKKDTKKKKKKTTKSDDSNHEESIDSVEDEKSQDSKKKSLKKPSATTKKHLSTNIKNTNPNYRIQRELKEFIKSPPPNLSVQVGSNIRVWIITMIGAENTIYEESKLPTSISNSTSFRIFLQGYIPIHEHVYTNGDICLSLLGKDWRPTMTAQSIAVSILSILSSAQSKSLPMDNARHAGNKPGEYQKDW